MVKEKDKSPPCAGIPVPSAVSQAKEGQMLSKEDFVTIQTLHRSGVNQVDIAEQLGIHPRTAPTPREPPSRAASTSTA